MRIYILKKQILYLVIYMVFVYIDDKKLLTKIIQYLELNKISVTTNYKDEYDKVIIGQINTKTKEIINEAYVNKKQIVFIAYNLESKIIKEFTKEEDNLFKKNFTEICDLSSNILVSLPAIKQILSKKICSNKIEILPREIPIIHKVTTKKRNGNIIIFDPNYKNIEAAYQIALKYPKRKVKVIGFQSDNLLTKKTKELIKGMPNNVIFIKYWDDYIYTSGCLNSSIIIYCDNALKDLYLLDILFISKKIVIVKDDIIFKNYLVNSKNSYTYIDDSDLLIKLKKIFDNRVANLTLESYDLIKNNNLKEISVKLSKTFH